MMAKENQIVVDASNSPAGRVASYASKQALLGNKVFVVNCDKAIVTGNKRSVIGEFMEMRTRGGHSLNGPHYPSIPFRIIKRMVRGMLPYKQERGRMALKRVICYNDTPKELESSKKVSLVREIRSKSIALKELSREM
jgi:large subunit ribosomal protein L13